MITQTLDKRLAQVPFFEDMPARDLDFLAGCASNVAFDEDEIILRQGHEADAFYLINSGQVALELTAERTFTIETLEKDDILGWSWLLPPYEWRYDARAVTRVSAIRFEGNCVRDKCEEDDGFGYHVFRRFSKIIAGRLVATRLQLLDIYQ